MVNNKRKTIQIDKNRIDKATELFKKQNLLPNLRKVPNNHSTVEQEVK